MGLLYLAKMLEQEGDEVKIIDYTAEQYKEKKLIKILEEIDVVGLTVLSFSVKQTEKLIKKIKEINPHITVIIGGPHCTLFPSKSLEETHADISVQGYGELTILEIKKALNKKTSFSQVKGIYYKENNKIKPGKSIEKINNLDIIPFPARNLVRNYDYVTVYNPRLKKGEFTSIITSRGCPFNCRFCSRGSISMQKYSPRSTENIIEELKEIKKSGFKSVAFVDDCFLANKNQAMEIFNQIIKEKIDLKFYIAAARVDSADEKLYSKMKQAGVIFIQFGLESGNQDVLDFYNKNTTVEKIKYAVKLSNKNGFFTAGSFIIGAPFENEKHFRKTINFAKTLPLVSVSFVPLKYMAGSELWYKAIEQGKISQDEYIITADSDRDLSKFPKEKLIKWSIKAHREFYIRPRFFINFLVVSIKQNNFSFMLSYILYYFISLFGKRNNYNKL